MLIDLTKEEIATILVGMVEFEEVIENKLGFESYKGPCGRLTEKFRKLSWDIYFMEKEKK